MSQSKKHLNSSNSNSEQPIETVYTTVETQTDQTDWLTVVSNLRQGNRQLLEQIAKLEQALATSQQSLQNQKEEKQSQEITILQLQDELKVAQDRIGGLFQQLETSHQIGQRQQTLIETLSQQLEITQAIVPQLEAENNELREQNQKQAEKLAKTEQVALEIHRRFKQLQATAQPQPETPTATPTEITATTVEVLSTEQMNTTASPASDDLVATLLTIDDPVEHRHQFQSNPLSGSNPMLIPSSIPLPTELPVSTEVTDKESTVEMNAPEGIEENTPHWPAPKLDREAPRGENRQRKSIKASVKLDLPKFPKK